MMKAGSPPLEPHCLPQVTEKEPEGSIINSRPTGGLTGEGCHTGDPNLNWGTDRSFWRRGHLSWARPGIGETCWSLGNRGSRAEGRTLAKSTVSKYRVTPATVWVTLVEGSTGASAEDLKSEDRTTGGTMGLYCFSFSSLRLAACKRKGRNALD